MSSFSAQISRTLLLWDLADWNLFGSPLANCFGVERWDLGQSVKICTLTPIHSIHLFNAASLGRCLGGRWAGAV